MAREIEISLHHIRVDLKAFGNWYAYEYDVPVDIWPKYEALHRQKNVNCHYLPHCLYNRLYDDRDEDMFSQLISYDLEEFHTKIVRPNVCTELKYI